MSNRPISGLFGAAFTLRASAFDFAAYSAVKVIARNGALILIVAVGLALSSIACFAEDKIGNAITIKTSGLYPPPINLAGGLAVGAGIVGTVAAIVTTNNCQSMLYHSC
jgi:hypothetical protein